MEMKMPEPSCSEVLSSAFKSSLGSSKSYTNCKHKFNSDLLSVSKRLLLNSIEFEEVETGHSNNIQSLKSKYVVLSSEKENNISQPDKSLKLYATKQTEKLVQSYGKKFNETKDSQGFPCPKIQLYNPDKIVFGRKKDCPTGAGMMNIGNTCYMNSCLQVLLHCPPFVNWLKNDEHYNLCKMNVNFVRQCTICAVHQTLKASILESGSVIKPIVIFKLLKSICKSFIPGNQEDAHEFLRHLIGSMEKSYLISARAMKLDSRSKETTPLNFIFGGYLRSQVLCLQCKQESNTWEHFQDLLLDLKPGCTTIEECLMVYFKKEKLEGANAYFCVKCKTKVPAMKKFSIEKAPPVLIVTFKRFNCFGSKISRPIQFSQTLNVSNFLTGNKFTGDCKYKLLGIVNHHGPSPNCGHYTAIAETSENQFHKFDDSKVYPISMSSVLNQSSAYILMYELISKPDSDKTCRDFNFENNAKTKTSKSNGSALSNNFLVHNIHGNGKTGESNNTVVGVKNGKTWNSSYIANGSISKIVCHDSLAQLVPYVDDFNSDSDSNPAIKCINSSNVPHPEVRLQCKAGTSLLSNSNGPKKQESSPNIIQIQSDRNESTKSDIPSTHLESGVMIEYDCDFDKRIGKMTKLSAEFLPRSLQVSAKNQFKLKSTNNSGCWSVDGIIQMDSSGNSNGPKNDSASDDISVPCVKTSENMGAAFGNDKFNHTIHKGDRSKEKYIASGEPKDPLNGNTNLAASKYEKVMNGLVGQTSLVECEPKPVTGNGTVQGAEKNCNNKDSCVSLGDQKISKSKDNSMKSIHKKHKKKKKNKKKQRSRSSSESSSSEFEWVEKPKVICTSSPNISKVTQMDKVRSDPKLHCDGSRYRTAELLESMNVRGFGGNVKTWDGKPTSLDSEVREEMVYGKRKKYEYDSDDEMDRGKVKKIKKNKFLSKSSFNPFQNFQNFKHRSVSFFDHSGHNGNSNKHYSTNKY